MAAATVAWSHTSARWTMTWSRPAAFRMLRAGAGWRTATRTFNPSPARRRTSRRPRNPEPPNTTTVVMAYPSARLGPLVPPSDERYPRLSARPRTSSRPTPDADATPFHYAEPIG